MDYLEWIKIVVVSIIEGITEWLPISSTAHILFWEDLFPFKTLSADFLEMFNVVIQLGAILAVVTLYFNKLNPFALKKTRVEKTKTYELWLKVIVACIPAGVIGILFDDWMDEHLYDVFVSSVMLILYGIIFIIVENNINSKKFKVVTLEQLSMKTALMIGLFQVLALVPGTSRSGATIIGAMIIGCSRVVAAEFTFFLAIPVMFGASFLKIVKFLSTGAGMSAEEMCALLLGTVLSYAVSIFAIKFLMGYIKNHSFRVFGNYRIIVGCIILFKLILEVVRF